MTDTKDNINAHAVYFDDANQAAGFLHVLFDEARNLVTAKPEPTELEKWTDMKCKLHLSLDECKALLEEMDRRMLSYSPVAVTISDLAKAVGALVTEAMTPLKGYATLPQLTKAQNLLEIAISMCRIGDSLSKQYVP